MHRSYSNIICIAGKNNIAVDVCQYVLDHYPQIKVYALTNRNDDGIDNWQRSYLKFVQETPNVTLTSLEKMYGIKDLIFLSVEYDRIINPKLFKTNYLYNLHFSLLPAYKGVYPSVWPILNGEQRSGVTLHYMDQGIDTGDIIAQKIIPLSKSETSFSLYFKLIDAGTKLVIRYIDRLLKHNVKGYQQPIGGSTYYSRQSIDYSNIKIDLFKTAAQIDSQIRAYYFPAYQLPKVFGVAITHTRITKERSMVKAGILLQQTKRYLKVSTIDYNILLYRKD